MENDFNDLMKELTKEGEVFDLPKAKKIINIIYDNLHVERTHRLHNCFFYEIVPLLTIAEHIGMPLARISFMGTEAQFDGKIYLEKGRGAQKVEFTAAIDGHNDALQMELLGKLGHAPAFKKIKATGSKHKRKFGKNELNAISWDEYHQNTLKPLIESALVKKIEKAKSNQHYQNAWLGIVFDDWIQPWSDRKSERFDPFFQQILGPNPEKHAPFSRVFCIGISRQYIFDNLAPYYGSIFHCNVELDD